MQKRQTKEQKLKFEKTRNKDEQTKNLRQEPEHET